MEFRDRNLSAPSLSPPPTALLERINPKRSLTTEDNGYSSLCPKSSVPPLGPGIPRTKVTGTASNETGSTAALTMNNSTEKDADLRSFGDTESSTPQKSDHYPIEMSFSESAPEARKPTFSRPPVRKAASMAVIVDGRCQPPSSPLPDKGTPTTRRANLILKTPFLTVTTTTTAQNASSSLEAPDSALVLVPKSPARRRSATTSASGGEVVALKDVGGSKSASHSNWQRLLSSATDELNWCRLSSRLHSRGG